MLRSHTTPPVRACAALLLLAVLVPLTLARPAAAATQQRCLTDAFHHFSSMPAGAGAVVLYDHEERGQRRAAKRIARAIRTKIFPRFERLLQRRPPSDAHVRCFNGPDGRLDVYLTEPTSIPGLDPPEGTVAFVHPYTSATCAPRRPVFAAVRPSVGRFVLAHELFHAFQAAYDTADRCSEYSEWEEATATWAGDWVYPRDDTEHGHRAAIEKPEWPISFWGYGAWVFPRYLSEKFGAKTIRRIEEAKERYAVDAHVDRAIPGRLRERFPEFALYAWNQAPLPRVKGLGPSFRAWDRITAKPKAQLTTLALGGQRVATAPLPADRLRPLARAYRRIVVGDEKIRHLVFENPDASIANFHVRAMVRRADGSWTAENWDGKGRVEFCRDDPAQDVREIVLVYANSATNRYSRVAATPRLVAEDSCALRYRVLAASVSLSTTASAPDTLCGTQAGAKQLDGSGGEQPLDARNELQLRGGSVSGGVSVRVPAMWHAHHLDGCSVVVGEGLRRCSVDVPDRRPDGDGTWPISFSVDGRWDQPAWQVKWGFDRAEVGFVDVGEDECNVYIWGTWRGDENVQQVPRATFLSGDPVTLTFSGSGRPTFIGERLDATIDHTWTYSMTIQRVPSGG
jgi:hypothetical protein